MNTSIDPIFDLPIPDHARGWFDPLKTRKWVNENALNTFQKSLNKLESPTYKLKVKELKLVEPAKPFTYAQQNQALMDKKDLTIPLRGTIQLFDKKSGEMVDQKTTTIAHIPWVTERNTVILNGSEYVTTGQQRLKPGVYTRIKESGEAEAHVNVMPGTGFGGKVIFYPDRALFVYQVGTTQIKLYGLLHDLGVADSEMEKAWGKEIFIKNKMTYAGNEIDKFYSKIYGHLEEEA
jgi:DNA-directed RNA polymerase beta subunit